MVGKKHFGSDTRGAILALHKTDKNQRQIAEQLHLSKSTVNLWISRAKENGLASTPVPKKRSGRPRKTNLRTDQYVKRLVCNKPTITAKEIKATMYHVLEDVSERTIQHRLQKELGLPSRRAAKKPLLNDKMREKRIDFF